MHLDAALVAAACGAVGGWFVPVLIGRLPEPTPDPSPSRSPGAQGAVRRHRGAPRSGLEVGPRLRRLRGPRGGGGGLAVGAGDPGAAGAAVGGAGRGRLADPAAAHPAGAPRHRGGDPARADRVGRDPGSRRPGPGSDRAGGGPVRLLGAVVVPLRGDGLRRRQARRPARFCPRPARLGRGGGRGLLRLPDLRAPRPAAGDRPPGPRPC